ncbi:MAG: hypothetical protein ACRD96_13825, partial [Bryobacteraceae bacterium]
FYDFQLRSGRRSEFLLGFYSRLAFAHSRHVLASSEGAAFIGYNTRNGGWIGPNDFFPNSAANSETLALLRQMLVYEELESNVETGRIHLMAGVPAAWLEPGKRIRVERAPTFFGEISYEAQAGDDGVHVTLQAPRRDRWREIVVHVPRPAVRVTLNGKAVSSFKSGSFVVHYE